MSNAAFIKADEVADIVYYLLNLVFTRAKLIYINVILAI